MPDVISPVTLPKNRKKLDQQKRDHNHIHSITFSSTTKEVGVLCFEVLTCGIVPTDYDLLVTSTSLNKP
jgi:hypothetical protein